MYNVLLISYTLCINSHYFLLSSLNFKVIKYSIIYSKYSYFNADLPCVLDDVFLHYLSCKHVCHRVHMKTVGSRCASFDVSAHLMIGWIIKLATYTTFKWLPFTINYLVFLSVWLTKELWIASSALQHFVVFMNNKMIW